MMVRMYTGRSIEKMTPISNARTARSRAPAVPVGSPPYSRPAPTTYWTASCAAETRAGVPPARARDGAATAIFAIFREVAMLNNYFDTNAHDSWALGAVQSPPRAYYTVCVVDYSRPVDFNVLWWAEKDDFGACLKKRRSTHHAAPTTDPTVEQSTFSPPTAHPRHRRPPTQRRLPRGRGRSSRRPYERR